MLTVMLTVLMVFVYVCLSVLVVVVVVCLCFSLDFIFLSFFPPLGLSIPLSLPVRSYSSSTCSTTTTSCRSNNPSSITTPSSSSSSSLYSSSLPSNSHATYHQYCCPARLRLPKPPCALPPAKHHEQAR